MIPTKRLTGTCTECGGPIQFPAELVGTTTQCPLCRKQTELRLATPPEEPILSRKGLLLTAVAIVILVAGLVTSLLVLRHFEKLAARQRANAAAAAVPKGVPVPAGLGVSAVSLQKVRGGTGLEAVTTVVNKSGRPCSKLTVGIDLLDAEGKKVEVARLYRPMLEPGAKWDIKVAIASDSKVVSARLASVTQGQ